VSLARGQFG